MMGLNERIAQAETRRKVAEHQLRVQRRQVQKTAEAIANRRHYVVGEMVCASFPELNQFIPGTDAENRIRFAGLETVLRKLAADPELHARLEAALTASPTGHV